LPALLIETVSAGGGSIARLDEGGALKVGPESAGAVPGPACYGRGGDRPTVTDACLVLGWLDDQHPLADDVRLDRGRAHKALTQLGKALGRDAAGAATAVVEIATAVMSRALRRVSVARGIDPRTLALLPFGGAGPLFGCALADSLDMPTVVIPPHAGVLSALGLAAAAERVDVLASFHRPLERIDARIFAAGFKPLLDEAEGLLPGATLRRLADCRFAGQGYEVTVLAPTDEPGSLGEAFRAAHRRQFGHVSNLPVEVVNLRVRAERAATGARLASHGRSVATSRQRAVVIGGKSVSAAVWPLDDLPGGLVIQGPAVLAGRDATALIAPSWVATVHDSGALVARRT
jgi:N-methylhydantoinase A